MESHLILVFISTVLVTAALGQAVHLELYGAAIPNNSVVRYIDIGTSRSTLSCVTERVDCCSEDNRTTADWFTPSGEVADTQFTRSWRGLGSAEGYVYLLRNSSTSAASVQEGLYHCNIPAPNGDISTLCVGIYINDFDGAPTISGITYCQLSPEMFTLTCTSTGGPATTVTWTLDGSEITYDTNHVLTQTVVNTTTAEYSNTLTVIGREPGNYQCTVSNARGSATSQQLVVNNLGSSPTPPSCEVRHNGNAAAVLVGAVLGTVLLVVTVVFSVLLVRRLRHHYSSSPQENPSPSVEMVSGPGAIPAEECVAYGPHSQGQQQTEDHEYDTAILQAPLRGGRGGGRAIYSDPAYENLMGVASEKPVMGKAGLSSTTEETVYECWTN